MRIAHYVNQFFAGIGGEEANDAPVQIRDGAVGPGRALQQLLGDRGTVVATIVAGDNRFVEEPEASLAVVRDALERLRPDVVVAGPAFDAGRYGLACALVCKAAAELGIPAVTAMHPDNAGVLAHRQELVCVPTGTSPAEMVPVLRRVLPIALKRGRGEPLGPAGLEGYLPTGRRKPVLRDKPGAQRAVDTVLARVRGEPFTSEIAVRQYDVVPAPPPVADLKKTAVALVTTAGIVPRGNPDGQTNAVPRKMVRYEIAGRDELTVEGWESVHGGFKGLIYNTVNPAYALPLPALRALERRGEIGRVHREFFSVVGASCPVTDAQRMGREIAAELTRDEVGAVILEST